MPVEYESSSKCIETLENKLDKILDTMAAIDQRVLEQVRKSHAWEIPQGLCVHSSMRVGRIDSNHKLPTFGEFRSDEKIQGKIQKKLHQYKLSRKETGKATDFIKFECYRPGVHKVIRQIAWQ